MSYINVPKESFDVVYSLRTTYPQYTSILENIETNLNLRLWNQLSDDLITLSSKSELQTSQDLILLYNNLVMSTERAFNPMKLILIIQNVIKNFSANMNEALIFLENIEVRIEPKGEEKYFIRILKAFCLLDLNRLYECEDIIKSLKVQLEKSFEVDQLIYSNFSKLSAYYFEKKENYDEFYNNSLQFLAYVKENQISDNEKLNICYKMSVASLIGEKMFNFAELIEKDFFKLLAKSNYEWIYYLILSFNSAKVDQFLEMMNKYSTAIKQDKVLSSHVDFLQIKIRIAALLDLAFQKNKNERVLTYKEISQGCHCDMKDIEFLVIKALSSGLIKGYIDEVENKVVINWVQPKYLDREKISVLNDRIDLWISKANKVLGNFQETTAPLLI